MRVAVARKCRMSIAEALGVARTHGLGDSPASPVAKKGLEHYCKAFA